tara:strand:- start:200 stop:490 length:291 start_codon:yes stop_codon:yes gene_type:complete
MQSQATLLGKNKILIQLKEILFSFWNNLNNNQREVAVKIWKIITFKWQWQIAFNAPFIIIWILDRTIPSIHKFDMELLNSLSIPNWLISLFGVSNL